MNKAIILSVLLFLSSTASAQQYYSSTHASSNPYFYNIAAGGMCDLGEVNMYNRFQWLSNDLSSKINTQVLLMNKVLRKDEKIGDTVRNTKGYKWHTIGGRILRDRVNERRVTKVELTISHNLAVSKRKRFSFALGASLNRFKFKNDEFTPYNGIQNDPFQDPTLTYLYDNESNVRFTLFDLSIGTWLYSDKNYWGWSMENGLRTGKKIKNLAGNRIYRPSARLHHFTYGHYFKIKDQRKIELIFNFMMTEAIAPALETFLVYRHEAFYLGGGVRGINYVLLNAGVTLRSNMVVSFTYEFPISPNRRIFGNTAEFNFAYKF